VTIFAAAHTAFRTGKDTEAWQAYARATTTRRPELRAAIARAEAQIARAFGKGGK
jgi:hypothetical protein